MSIRQLAASFSGSHIAAGEFEGTVHVWDLATAKLTTAFPTILDFGGTRLAITGDGRCCLTAAYHVEGLAAYAANDGTELWRRRDLKKAQAVRLSIDDRRIYCSFDRKACHVLNRESGKTIRTLPGVRDVWESPYEPLMLLEKRTLVLQALDGKKVASIGRESFAVLRVAFAPGLVCVGESGGPLRCLSTYTGQEVWRYSQRGRHVVELAYAEAAKAFVGVSWAYEHGGPSRLLRFGQESGQASEVSELRHTEDRTFCQRGSRLLSSDGSVVDSATGRSEPNLPFAVRDNRGG